MQKSRKALHQRRALEKAIGRNHLYKFSLSLAILLWGLIFLLNLWISHGNGYRDESESVAHNVSSWDEAVTHNVSNWDEAVTHNVSSWDEAKLGSDVGSCLGDELAFVSLDSDHLTETCFEHLNETSCTDAASEGEEINGRMQSVKHPANGDSGSREHDELDTAISDVKYRKDNGKTDRLTRIVPPGLDEFKSKALNSRKDISGATGNIIHRVEPGGAIYNYASSAKGAKVLDSNKEAKGASNILTKDKDKYLRNPCSAEDKYVVIELSEETLVDTINIANFEHYSSNLKEFDLLGSLVYPTDNWLKLGKFVAANVKHAQNFTLHEPQWVRYLKLNILSHYGSEFYCTLSSIEVYGVDAVERMLVDLILVPDTPYATGEPVAERAEQETAVPISETAEPSVHDLNSSGESEPAESSNLQRDAVISTVPEPVEEARHQQVSRMPGDNVLKILMQKVRTLDLSLSILERYIGELNSRYGSIIKDLDKEMEEKDILVEKITSDIKTVLDRKDAMVKDIDEIMAWRSQVSMQLDGLLKDNAMLRSDVRRVEERQMYMESKGIVVFLVSIIFGLLGLVTVLIDMVYSVNRSQKPRKFCWLSSSWLLLFLSCTTIIIILSL